MVVIFHANPIGIRKDAHAAMDYLLNRHDIDHKKIIVFGRSLGGAVAVDLVSDVAYSDKYVRTYLCLHEVCITTVNTTYV